MIAVIFEVTPKAEGKAQYFDIALGLKEHLQQIDGFISVERFQSLVEPEKFLSLSFWRDEDAIKTWRSHMEHQSAQHQGRSELFADYRLRVASVVRDYGLNEREQAPEEFKSR